MKIEAHIEKLQRVADSYREQVLSDIETLEADVDDDEFLEFVALPLSDRAA
jgi:hypothetical protein